MMNNNFLKDDDLISGICGYQFKISMLYVEYGEFLRSKGYKCEQIGKLIYRIHPDYYDKWLETRQEGLPLGAVIQF